MFTRRSHPKRFRLLTLGLIALAWSVEATHIRGRRTANGGSLNGLWKEIAKNTELAFTIESRPDDLLVLKNAKATSPLHKIGDIIGEVRSRGEDEWIGRHVWGGELTGNVEWGENGGLVIQRISAEELFVRYLDSIYKDGWIYVRSR